ncbi:MAG: hypothetical protein ACYDBJ_17365 [Aggregatilineales bacterium]
MDAITIEAEVGHDHRLIDELPPEVPVGRVKLVIQPVIELPTHVEQGLFREEARRRLLVAGKLLTGRVAPEGAVHSSESEHRRLAELFGQGPSSDELIDEDRGSHE